MTDYPIQEDRSDQDQQFSCKQLVDPCRMHQREASFYDDMAPVYHLVIDDWEAAIERQRQEVLVGAGSSGLSHSAGRYWTARNECWPQDRAAFARAASLASSSNGGDPSNAESRRWWATAFGRAL